MCHFGSASWIFTVCLSYLCSIIEQSGTICHKLHFKPAPSQTHTHAHVRFSITIYIDVLGLNSTFFQGDIVLTEDMLRLLNDTSSTRRRRAIKKDLNARWTNGVVAYVIDRRLSKFIVFPLVLNVLGRWYEPYFGLFPGHQSSTNIFYLITQR